MFNPLLHMIQCQAQILQEVVGDPPEAEEINPVIVNNSTSQSTQPATAEENTLSPAKRKWKKIWKCRLCIKEFPFQARLKEHMRKHTGEKPFVCGICSKGFIKNSDLNRHKLTHSNDMTFMCIECGKCFSRLCNLRTHGRTHTGDRPYACSYCEKCFTRKDYLNEHERVHTGAKPYTCKICGKKFARPQDVSRHTKTHSSEKPYACTVCGKSYKQRRSLNAHAQTHAKTKSQEQHNSTDSNDENSMDIESECKESVSKECNMSDSSQEAEKDLPRGNWEIYSRQPPPVSFQDVLLDVHKSVKQNKECTGNPELKIEAHGQTSLVKQEVIVAPDSHNDVRVTTESIVSYTHIPVPTEGGQDSSNSKISIPECGAQPASNHMKCTSDQTEQELNTEADGQETSTAKSDGSDPPVPTAGGSASFKVSMPEDEAQPASCHMKSTSDQTGKELNAETDSQNLPTAKSKASDPHVPTEGCSNFTNSQSMPESDTQTAPGLMETECTNDPSNEEEFNTEADSQDIPTAKLNSANSKLSIPVPENRPQPAPIPPKCTNDMTNEKFNTEVNRQDAPTLEDCKKEHGQETQPQRSHETLVSGSGDSVTSGAEPDDKRAVTALYFNHSAPKVETCNKNVDIAVESNMDIMLENNASTDCYEETVCTDTGTLGSFKNE